MDDICLSRTQFALHIRYAACFLNALSFNARQVTFSIFQTATEQKIAFGCLNHANMTIVIRNEICARTVKVYCIFFCSKYFVHWVLSVSFCLSPIRKRES